MPAKRKAAADQSTATIGFEAKLWLAADKLRNNMDAAEILVGQEQRVWGARFGRAKRARRVRLRGKQPNQSNATTRRLAVMNLALRGIEADFGPEHADTFRRDLHPDPAWRDADYVLANPPFNDSDTALRGSAFLQSEAKPQVVSVAKDNFRKGDDVRWQFGVPPKGNANLNIATDSCALRG